MAEYSGSALFFSWIYPSGTINFSADYRTLTDSVEGNIIDASAGSDPYTVAIGGIQSGKVSLTYVEQAGGTTNLYACDFGIQGTIVYGPEGTAVGKPKRTIPAMAQGWSRSEEYTNVPIVTVNWQYVGAPTKGAY